MLSITIPAGSRDGFSPAISVVASVSGKYRLELVVVVVVIVAVVRRAVASDADLDYYCTTIPKTVRLYTTEPRSKGATV